MITGPMRGSVIYVIEPLSSIVGAKLALLSFKSRPAWTTASSALLILGLFLIIISSASSIVRDAKRRD